MRHPLVLVFATALPLSCAPPSPISAGGVDGSSAVDPLSDDAGDLPGLGGDSGFGLDPSSSWDATTPPTFEAAAGPPPGDASAPADAAEAASDGSPEADAPGVCTTPLGPGVLAIDELMIASEAGSGDYGEWLEIESTVPCAIDLRGLYAEDPNGSTVISLEVTSDLWVPPYGTFIIADSIDPAINHSLPGALLAWTGEPGDALRDEGGTLTLSIGGVVVDSLTYPSLKLTDGSSMAFPASCPLSRRTDWTAWQTSTASWFPGFHGTPNAPNTDVICP